MGFSISVVIPMYNAKNTIILAIMSVLEQQKSYVVEIIVVDDGSNDRSVDVVRKFIKNKRYEDFIKLVCQENKGVSSARNTGMRMAKGNFIAFLDADDRWEKNKLKRQREAFLMYPNAGMVGGTINGKKHSFFYLKKFNGFTKITMENMLFKNFFPTPTVVIKKSVLSTVGYFEEEKRYMEDYEYFFRICIHYEAILINESLAVCGEGKPTFGYSGLSANLKEMEKGELDFLRKTWKNGHINFYKYVIITFYSLMKYCRRNFIVKCRNLKI